VIALTGIEPLTPQTFATESLASSPHPSVKSDGHPGNTPTIRLGGWARLRKTVRVPQSREIILAGCSMTSSINWLENNRRRRPGLPTFFRLQVLGSRCWRRLSRWRTHTRGLRTKDEPAFDDERCADHCREI